MSRHDLDARYLLCPMPVIRAQEAIEKLTDGDVLEVRATDPGALYDIPAWCKVHGHEVLAREERAGDVIVTVRVRRA